MSGVQWLLVLSGGLAGALFTQAINWLVYIVRCPRLGITSSPDERGCVVETPATLLRSGTTINGRQRYLRICMKNRGWTAALGVNVSATTIEYSVQNSGAQLVFAEEVLELHLALSDRTEFALPRGAHRFVDVLCVEEFGSGPDIRFAFAQIPSRFSLLGFARGQYCLGVIATAQNTRPKKQSIFWNWDGTFDGLHIIRRRRYTFWARN